MSMLSNLNYDASKSEDKDILGSGATTPSDVYLGTIKVAYYSKAASGAIAVNLDIALDAGRNHRETIYISNRKGEFTYTDSRTNEAKYLPGFVSIDSLCLLTVGQPLVNVDKQVETKTLNIYNFEQRKEIPTDVPVLMPLVGKRVKLGLLEVRENKTKKNDSTGKYNPINEPRQYNTIDKFFRESDDRTTEEIKAKIAKAEFINKWTEKHQGKLNDKYKEVSGTGNAGAPGGAFAGAAQSSGSSTPPADNPFM